MVHTRLAALPQLLPFLLAMQRPAIGAAVAWLPALDLQGVDRPLREYSGPKGLVVFFWAGWSERSIEELKRIEAAQKDIRDHGVGIVAVNVEHEAGAASVPAVKDKAAALGITVPVVVDDGLKIFRAYGVVSVPTGRPRSARGSVPGSSAARRGRCGTAHDTVPPGERLETQVIFSVGLSGARRPASAPARSPAGTCSDPPSE